MTRQSSQTFFDFKSYFQIRNPQECHSMSSKSYLATRRSWRKWECLGPKLSEDQAHVLASNIDADLISALLVYEQGLDCDWPLYTMVSSKIPPEELPSVSSFPEHQALALLSDLHTRNNTKIFMHKELLELSWKAYLTYCCETTARIYEHCLVSSFVEHQLCS